MDGTIKEISSNQENYGETEPADYLPETGVALTPLDTVRLISNEEKRSKRGVPINLRPYRSVEEAPEVDIK